MHVASSDPNSTQSRTSGLVRHALGAGLMLATGLAVQPVQADQWGQYNAVRAKSIIELQPLRKEQKIGDVRLISLNPSVNAWFLLSVGNKTYHLENPNPRGQKISLGAGPSLKLSGASCTPFGGELAKAAATRRPFAAICGGKLYLRNPVRGATLSMKRGAPAASSGKSSGGPSAAKVDGSRPVISAKFGVNLNGTKPGQVAAGAWYGVAGLNGVYASAIQPKLISKSVLQGPGTVNALDSAELGSMVYLIAFDMSRHSLGYAVGTQEPALKWSSRPPGSVRAGGLPGPDGVSSAKPLVPLGVVPPQTAGRVVATFAGGFKRHHGAFRSGQFAGVNGGSHYGFVENGVVFSKLQPGLSTLLVTTGGQVQIKTWGKGEERNLGKIRFARQNGVPLIEGGKPGRYVTQWGAGNWSGSAQAKLRTLRAGACMAGKHLVYAYFYSATPSAMARTFQAYGCKYAMLLDMNAPELTYMGLYFGSGGNRSVGHMVPQMAASDRGSAPKFLGATDTRDMFYVIRK